MTDAPPSTPPQGETDAPPETPADLQQSFACLACGYDLRGLGGDGRCPECGTPVERSLNGRLLQFAPPGYVRRLAWGLTIILVTLPLGILVCGGVGILFRYSRLRIDGPTGDLIDVLRGLFSLTMSLFGLIGAWLVTTPDPAEVNEQHASRSALRAMVVLGLGLWLIALLTGGGREFLFLCAAFIFVFGFGLLGLFMWLAYLHQLATRMPHHGVARTIRIFAWTITVGLVVVLPVCFFLDTTGGLFQIVATTVLVVSGLWSLVVMTRCCHQLHTCAKAAAANHAAGVRRASPYWLPVIQPRGAGHDD